MSATLRNCPACEKKRTEKPNDSWWQQNWTGTLIVREGQFGRFTGCSKFPYCRYKEKDAELDFSNEGEQELNQDELLHFEDGSELNDVEIEVMLDAVALGLKKPEQEVSMNGKPTVSSIAKDINEQVDNLLEW